MATTGTDLTHAATAFIDAFNRADWDAFRGSLAADAVYTETGTRRRAEGADAYLELSQGWKSAFPDAEGTVRNAIVSGDTVAMEVHWDGTHDGPLQTPDGAIPPTGKRVSIDCSFWMTFDGDHARELRHYVDLITLMEQIGALPAAAQ